MGSYDLPLFEYHRREPVHGSQRAAIRELMSDGQWRTVDQIDSLLRVRFGISAIPTGIQARLRELRNPKHGAHRVDSEPTDREGIWRFRLHPAGTHVPDPRPPAAHCPHCHGTGTVAP
jgi:hypothetical protein